MNKIQRTSKGNYVYRGYEIRRYTHERNYSIYNPEINEFLANETSLQDCTNSIDIDLKTISEILREVKQSFRESTYNRISEHLRLIEYRMAVYLKYPSIEYSENDKLISILTRYINQLKEA